MTSVGLEVERLQRFATEADAKVAIPADGIWQPRWSGFGECWLLASLTEDGHLRGYLLDDDKHPVGVLEKLPKAG